MGRASESVPRVSGNLGIGRRRTPATPTIRRSGRESRRQHQRGADQARRQVGRRINRTRSVRQVHGRATVSATRKSMRSQPSTFVVHEFAISASIRRLCLETLQRIAGRSATCLRGETRCSHAAWSSAAYRRDHARYADRGSTLRAVRCCTRLGRPPRRRSTEASAGIVKDASGAAMPGATVTVTSVERKTVDTVVTNESGFYVKDRLLPGTYEVKAELTGFKTAVLPEVRVSVDTQTPIDFELQVGAAHRADRGHRRIAVAEDRSRRRLHELRFETDHRPAGARSQLHQVHPADAGHAAARLAARGERKPAGLHPDDGQRAALQRHGLSARWHREPRSDPRHHRHQSHARVDRETKITSQNYDAEFGQATAGVVSVQTKSGRNQLFGSAFEFHQDDRFQSRNPFTQFQVDPLTGKHLPKTEQGSVRRLDWRQDRREPGVLLRRLPGHTQHRRRLEAADRADARRARAATSAPTASTSTIPRRRAACSSFRAT